MITRSTRLMVLICGLLAVFALGMAWHGYSQQRATSAADLSGGGLKGAGTGNPDAAKVLANGVGNNILLNPSGGNVGIGTFTPSEQLEITGNFRLPATTATTGIIKSGGDRLIHSFGANNFFAGVNAGNLTMTGFGDNTGVGVASLSSNATGIRNTAFGRSTLSANAAGERNTAVGASALLANTGGDNNTAIGENSLFDNTTGDNNTAVGSASLANNTLGGDNTAIGSDALILNTTGSLNTATGKGSLFSNTTGIRNTATGRSALSANTTGHRNTGAGTETLESNTTGSFNTALGFGANVSAGDLTNATVIGANAVVDASNKIRLGDSGVTVIEGEVAFTFTSDANQKENFLDVDGEETLEKLSEIWVGSWNYQGHDPARFRHYGPTAQEFFAAFGHDDLGAIGAETTVNSGDLGGVMLIAIQALERRTADLESQRAGAAVLQRRINALEARLAEFETPTESPAP